MQILERFFGSRHHTATPLTNEQILAQLHGYGAEDPESALNSFSTSLEGLSPQEVQKRLKKYGRNDIAHEKIDPWWVQLFNAFINPFILILFVLAVASYISGMIAHAEDTWAKIIILGAMVLISGGLRFWQEFRSQRAIKKLQALVQNKVLVIRKNGNTHQAPTEIPITHLVPGDIVTVSAGDMIPGDMRILRAQDLFIDQSTLTGESIPLEKFESHPSAIPDNALEMRTLAFMGTNVINGSGMGVIVATANNTYFGSIAKKIINRRIVTSFDQEISRVSWLLIRFMLVMVPIVFLLNGFIKGDWHESFFFALAVAVGLTPEMLPLVVTANMSKGAIAMAKKKVIVRRINALQNFGAMNILCTDKTGTITENRIVLVRYLNPAGNEDERVLHLAYLNSFFQTGLRNLMDQAIVDHKEKDHISDDLDPAHYQKIDEIPFDFSRRRMSVIVQKDTDNHLLICKGAVDETLALCTSLTIDGKTVPLSAAQKTTMAEVTKNLNNDGMRVLIVAYKTVPVQKTYSLHDETDLVLAGCIGFFDPPKASAAAAIEQLHTNGVDIKIITGDNEIVTASICRQVGIDASTILVGSELAKLTDEQLDERVEKTTIFARIDPLQKGRIVTALRKKGNVVGYMGDGVNDAAALKEADVSISVNSAVDIVKEIADMILLENDLGVLQHGVLQGRTTFGNIMKYIKMTTSSNFGNVLSILVASIFLPFLPMLPMQILLQNLLYDISQLAISWDTMSTAFLSKPRRWQASSIMRFMLRIGPVSSLFDITTFLGLWFIFKAQSPSSQSLFQSGWFVEGLLSQTLIVHMIRTEKIPFIQSRAPIPVILWSLLIMATGIIIPFTPIGKSIGLQALPALYFPFLIITLVSYCILVQFVKMLYIKKFNEWL